MRTILALTGVKESGKTTTFGMIRELLPDAIELTLAKKLKDVCAEVLEVPREHFDDQAFKEKEMDRLVTLDSYNVNKILQRYNEVFQQTGHVVEYDKHIRPHIGKILETPRQIAQYVGTEVLRSVSPKVHCDAVAVGLPDTGVFVLTDMRFPDEFEYFQNLFGKEFHPGYVQNYRAEAKMGPNPHASEKYVLEIGKKCYRLDNNGSFKDLNLQVKEFLGKLIEGAPDADPV